MIRTRQFVNGKWSFGYLGRDLQKGDVVQFTGKGVGRGGHYSVTATVTKVNRVNFLAVENPGSYGPGTLYNWPKHPPESNVYLLLARRIE